MLCWLGSLYIRLIGVTTRWQVVGGDIPEKFWENNKPFIVAFWHGRLLMVPYCWDLSKTVFMLISQHRDGQIIARTVSHFGFRSAEGSSSKGGARALRQMLKVLDAGDYVGITPDGPRGPRMRASEGIVSVARLSGVPVIPLANSVARGRNLNSWDRFLLPGPFSRGAIVWGTPIEVARDADEQAQAQARLRIEDSLNALTREADEMVGRVCIEPAASEEAGR